MPCAVHQAERVVRTFAGIGLGAQFACGVCSIATSVETLIALAVTALLHGRDPTPVECKYSGLTFVSKKALAYAAKKGK